MKYEKATEEQVNEMVQSMDVVFATMYTPYLFDSEAGAVIARREISGLKGVAGQDAYLIRYKGKNRQFKTHKAWEQYKAELKQAFGSL